MHKRNRVLFLVRGQQRGARTRERRDHNDVVPRMSRRTVVAAVAAVAVAVVVGILAFRAPSSSAAANPTSFDLPALDGTGTVRLSSYRGEPVVVDLFASWCSACRGELPAFAHIAASLRGRAQFIGVDSLETGDGAAMAEQYRLAANGFVLARDVGPGDSDLHDALRAPGMPVTVLYNPAGRIVAKDMASVPAAALQAQLRQYFGL